MNQIIRSWSHTLLSNPPMIQMKSLMKKIINKNNTKPTSLKLAPTGPFLGMRWRMKIFPKRLKKKKLEVEGDHTRCRVKGSRQSSRSWMKVVSGYPFHCCVVDQNQTIHQTMVSGRKTSTCSVRDELIQRNSRRSCVESLILIQIGKMMSWMRTTCSTERSVLKFYLHTK